MTPAILVELPTGAMSIKCVVSSSAIAYAQSAPQKVRNSSSMSEVGGNTSADLEEEAISLGGNCSNQTNTTCNVTAPSAMQLRIQVRRPGRAGGHEAFRGICVPGAASLRVFCASIGCPAAHA